MNIVTTLFYRHFDVITTSKQRLFNVLFRMVKRKMTTQSSLHTNTTTLNLETDCHLIVR